MNSETVSVIMPFLDGESFIEEAIESVLSQTHEDWELLLVDDGSKDRSSEIARAFAATHPARIRYLRHEGGRNRGVGVSRNLAVREGNGAFIAMLDSDDVWLPRRLEHQLEILRREPRVAMVYGNAEYWHSWTGNPEDARRDFVQPHGVPANERVEPPLALIRFLRGHAAVPCTCSTLLRREAVERVGGFEDEFTGLYDDQTLFVKLCLAAPIYVSDDCLARYRRHPASMCARVAHTEAELEARRVFIDWVDRYLTAQGGCDEELRQVITKERWLLRRTGRLVRFGKKWLLRGEERCVPATVRRRVWSRLELADDRMRLRRSPRR